MTTISELSLGERRRREAAEEKQMQRRKRFLEAEIQLDWWSKYYASFRDREVRNPKLSFSSIATLTEHPSCCAP